MRFRPLGRTGLTVSELTLGTSPLATPDLDRAEARAAMALALDSGVNAIELDAGNAQAIDLIADNIRPDTHVFARITSLVAFDLPSPHVTALQAYPGAQLRAQTEALLAQLGVDRLALLQLHAWCPEWLHEGDWLETAEALRREGKIAGIGISLFDHDATSGLEGVASGKIDAVQVMYNIFDQGARPALFPLCQKHDVGVIARAPLYFGALAGQTSFPTEDWRATYFYDEHRRETIERTQLLGQALTPPDETLGDMALRYALALAAISTVAIGLRHRAHVEAALRAAEHGPLSIERCAVLTPHRWLC